MTRSENKGFSLFERWNTEGDFMLFSNTLDFLLVAKCRYLFSIPGNDNLHHEELITL